MNLVLLLLQSFNHSTAMLGFIFLIFFYTLLWIPLQIRLKDAILTVAGVFRLRSLPELDGSGGGGLLVRRYGELRRNGDGAEEEMCSICLTELAREDSVCELRNCCHVFHFNCIEKWLEKNRFTCPLCRCVFFNNIDEKKLFRFVVPDNPSSLYYFLQ